MTLDIRGLSKFYGAYQALKDIDLSVGDDEFVCLLGPSGCGKTTLLRVVAGLESYEGGTMTLAGRDLASIGARDRGFGIVFQSYALFPHMTVAQNVGYGLKLRKRPQAEINRRVELLALVTRAFADACPGSFRAVSSSAWPSPARWRGTGAPVGRAACAGCPVQAGLRGFGRCSAGCIPTIMVTHDQEEALTMADKVVCMSAGRIEQIGSPTEIYTSPATRFVADFVGSSTLLTASAAVRRLTCPAGPTGCSHCAPRMC